MDGFAISCLDINRDTLQAITFLEEELQQMVVVLNEAKTVALPPMSHAAASRENAPLLVVRVSAAEEGRTTVVGILLSNEAFL